MKHPVAQAALGALLGLLLGASLCYGIVEFADWIVEETHHEISTPR